MKTIINIKSDKEVKERTQLKDFIRNKSVYLSTVPRMTPYLEKIIEKAEKDYKAGKNISGPFSSAKEMDECLNS